MKNYRYQLRLKETDGSLRIVSTAYKGVLGLLNLKRFFAKQWNLPETDFDVYDSHEKKVITK